MVVLDDDGVCPLGRDEDLPARHKQSVTAAPKETDRQKERRQSGYVFKPLTLHRPPDCPLRLRHPRSRSEH